MVINNMMNKKLKGFSLFEAFVVMLIIASEAHGRFECYYDNSGKLYQQMYTEKSTTGREQATKEITLTDADGNTTTHKVCEFVPPSYAKYLIIDAVGGGAGGSPRGGASEGQFVSTFYASIERKYYILPGVGGRKRVLKIQRLMMYWLVQSQSGVHWSSLTARLHRPVRLLMVKLR